MKSKLSKTDKRRRKVLKDLRATIDHQAKELRQRDSKIDYLNRQLATHSSTVISNEVMELRYSLYESALGHELTVHFEAKNQELYALTREIVRLPSFRMGYNHVIDSLRLRSMNDKACVLEQIVHDLGKKMGVCIMDHIIKTTPIFNRSY